MKEDKHVPIEPSNNHKTKNPVKFSKKKMTKLFFEYLKSLLITGADNIIGYFTKTFLIDIPIIASFYHSYFFPLFEVGVMTVIFGLSKVEQSKDKDTELNIQFKSISCGFSFGKITEIISQHLLDLSSIFYTPLVILFSSISGSLTSFFYEKWLRFKYGKSKIETEKNGSGINPSKSPGNENKGGPGGVEFKKIEPIKGINEPDNFLNKNVNIFIETDSEADIKAAFNSLCLPKYKNRSIQEYFETIMQEVSDSLDLNIDLPFVSLHFNNDKTLYSVMHSFYKNTIIGNVFTFLDYFLKGFVNGGFFSIDFVRSWSSKKPNERITDTDILNKNLIKIKDSLKKIGKNQNYYSLNELINQDETSANFTSAFRIIGKMDLIEKVEDILIPNGDFFVEHDLNTKPRMQKKLNLENKESLEKSNDISSVYYLFDQIIQEIMPQVPEFKGFFKILNMITFAFHYNISLRSIGKTVKTCNAFHYNKKYVEYVPQIPEVFPPLPVSNRKEILIEIKFNEIMNHLNKTKFLKEINKILHDEQDDFTKDCLNEMNEKIKSFYRSKAFSLLEDKDLHNDNFIHLNKMVDVIIEYMKNATNFVKFGFYQLLTKMENFLKKENKYVRNCSDNMSFSQLKAQCTEYMKIITNLIANKKRESEDRILQLQMTLDQNINYENILKKKPLTQQNSNQLQQIRQTINNLTNEINETKKVNSEKNVKFFLFRGILEKNLENLSDILDDFESKYQNAISPIPLI